jgi:CBS domain containing-hemolysin-like protein
MIPALVTMAVLICCSAFFSASEAALFYLRWYDRRVLATGSPAQRIAERLLHDPDRLLSAVLFWNLVINILYFTLASMVGIRLERDPKVSQTSVVAFTVGSLLMIIFFSEMLPKSVAVLRARSLAGVIGVPLAAAIRLVDPIMPSLRVVTELSRRLIWPSLKPESSLELADVERAIGMSTDEEELLAHEQIVLSNIISLSELDVREWMRPRKQIRGYHPPISIDDIRQQESTSGYVFIVGSKANDVVAALPLDRLIALPPDHLELQAGRVVCVPWCATVADAFQAMRHEESPAAAVVNELGETIGVITEHDVLAAVLTVQPERGERLLNREAIVDLDDGCWLVEGVTNLSRLQRHFDVQLPTSRNVTLGGVVQEVLERLPNVGDTCRWGPFDILVTQAGEHHDLQLKVRLANGEGSTHEAPE